MIIGHNVIKVDPQPVNFNRIDGVSCAVDRVIKPRPGQTKDNKFGIYCFPVKHAALMSKSKYWLSLNQHNVYQWSDMSTHRLLIQRYITIKIRHSVLV